MKLYTIKWFHKGTFMQRHGCTWDEMNYVHKNVTSQGGTVTGISSSDLTTLSR